MSGGSAENKLLGVLTLDYKEVEKAVGRVNELLATLGGGANLDLTDAFKKQFNELSNKIDKALQDTKRKASQSSQAMSGGF